MRSSRTKAMSTNDLIVTIGDQQLCEVPYTSASRTSLDEEIGLAHVTSRLGLIHHMDCPLRRFDKFIAHDPVADTEGPESLRQHV